MAFIAFLKNLFIHLFINKFKGNELQHPVRTGGTAWFHTSIKSYLYLYCILEFPQSALTSSFFSVFSDKEN